MNQCYFQRFSMFLSQFKCGIRNVYTLIVWSNFENVPYHYWDFVHVWFYRCLGRWANDRYHRRWEEKIYFFRRKTHSLFRNWIQLQTTWNVDQFCVHWTRVTCAFTQANSLQTQTEFLSSRSVEHVSVSTVWFSINEFVIMEFCFVFVYSIKSIFCCRKHCSGHLWYTFHQFDELHQSNVYQSFKFDLRQHKSTKRCRRYNIEWNGKTKWPII